MSTTATTAKPFEAGQVLLATYPFTNHAATKVRPILVVSKTALNVYGDFVAVPISSNIKSPIAGSHAIIIDDTAPYFAQTGLKQPSVVKWTKPMTLTGRIVHRTLGTVPEDVLHQITAKVASLFEGQPNA